MLTLAVIFLLAGLECPINFPPDSSCLEYAFQVDAEADLIVRASQDFIYADETCSTDTECGCTDDCLEPLTENQGE